MSRIKMRGEDRKLLEFFFFFFFFFFGGGGGGLRLGSLIPHLIPDQNIPFSASLF